MMAFKTEGIGRIYWPKLIGQLVYLVNHIPLWVLSSYVTMLFTIAQINK